MEKEKFSTIIRQALLKKGWNQALLAQKVGVSEGVVSRILNGPGKRVTLDTIRKFADVLGINEDIFFAAEATAGR